jgi:two-component system cell cycle response regulator CtrA
MSSGQGSNVPNPIKVLLADESRAVRLVLASLLREDGRFDVVAAVATGAETIERCGEADLVVVDLVLEDIDGFAVIESLHATAPHLPVVIFAAVDPPYLRSEANSRGAAGFFTHRTDPAELLDGFEAAVLRRAIR